MKSTMITFSILYTYSSYKLGKLPQQHSFKQSGNTLSIKRAPIHLYYYYAVIEGMYTTLELLKWKKQLHFSYSNRRSMCHCHSCYYIVIGESYGAPITMQQQRRCSFYFYCFIEVAVTNNSLISNNNRRFTCISPIIIQ